MAGRPGCLAGQENRHAENVLNKAIKSDKDCQSTSDSCRHVYYERSINTHRRSDRKSDSSVVLRPAESVVNDRTGVLPVRVNPISTGMLNQGAFEAGPDVVAGMADLESDFQIRSHVVKVAGHSVDVDYPIRTARGRGGTHYCATATRNLGADGFISSVQDNPKSPGGTLNNCMCKKNRV